MFITALFTTAKIQKQPMCPSTDNWVKKMRVRVCVCVLAQWNITSPCMHGLHIYLYYGTRKTVTLRFKFPYVHHASPENVPVLRQDSHEN